MLRPEDVQLRPYQEEVLRNLLTMMGQKSAQMIPVEMPTGTGKTLPMVRFAQILRKAHDTIIIHTITSRVQIMVAFLEQQGISCEGLSEGKIRKLAESSHIYTYIRYRNLLQDGKLQRPHVCIIDEMHHCTMDNKGFADVYFYLRNSTVIGFTATYFRASPAQTKKLHDVWGKNPLRPITLREAAAQGYWKMPEMHFCGKINDDLVQVFNGKVVISSMNALYAASGTTIYSTGKNRIQEHQAKFNFPAPTIVALPSVEVCTNFCEYLNAAGIPATSITHETPSKERVSSIEKLKSGSHVLCQVGILSEGVDFPWLRILIIMKPMFSPVEFMQTFGRLTRPCEGLKICDDLTRTVERFYFMLCGLIPSSQLLEMQGAFETRSTRMMRRSLGVGADELGRFKPIPFTRSDGMQGSFYCINKIISKDALKEESTQKQYVAILQPDRLDPIIAVKENTFGKYVEGQEFKANWGTWKRTTMEDGFAGYKSATRKKAMSPKQLQWWVRDAQSCGLDASVTPDGRQFQILPVAKDLGISL